MNTEQVKRDLINMIADGRLNIMHVVGNQPWAHLAWPEGQIQLGHGQYFVLSLTPSEDEDNKPFVAKLDIAYLEDVKLIAKIAIQGVSLRAPTRDLTGLHPRRYAKAIIPYVTNNLLEREGNAYKWLVGERDIVRFIRKLDEGSITV